MNYKKGVTVNGGKDGLFIEKPDIIDKFCRREIKEKNPELEKLPALQFSKMYDPIRRKKSQEEEGENTEQVEDESESNQEMSEYKEKELWKNDEERIANFYITGDPNYNYIRLPKIIKLKNCSTKKRRY